MPKPSPMLSESNAHASLVDRPTGRTACPQAAASGSLIGATGVARASRPAGPTSRSASEDVDREVDAAGWEACATKTPRRAPPQPTRTFGRP